MINFTLTITAVPELLAAISNFTNAITSAKVVTIPQESPSIIPVSQVQMQQQAPAQISSAQALTVPTAIQTYTMEQLAVAAAQIIDSGRRAEISTLLGSFGVQALIALPKERYGEFATKLRALGAKSDNL